MDPQMAGALRVLLIGGSPQVPSAELVRAAAASCDAVVCVDRGLDAALAAGVTCDLFCGDLDSVSERGAAVVCAARGSNGDSAGEGRTMQVECYDPHKDLTDLSLALRATSERWRRASLVAIGCSGGAPDHLLGVLGRFAAHDGVVELIEDAFIGRVLHDHESWMIKDSPGRRFSFIPLRDPAIVSVRGMRWELDRAPVALLCDLGISNVIESDAASIRCHAGALAAWVFKSGSA